MQTTLSTELIDDPRAIAAEAILRKCVHCGFCLATCPTYNLLGNELDSPRGRIYLMKQVVEGHKATATTRSHLDRCLTCRNCETTCPSGVEYGHLLDIGRSLVEEQVPRGGREKWLRKGLLSVLPYSRRVTPLVKLGHRVRPFLPGALAKSIPMKNPPGLMPEPRHDRHMLVLDGCVQPSMAPSTNASAARVLDALGITLKGAEKSGCCGAVHYHLNEQESAKNLIRRNIDAWWPSIEAGCEAIVVTASGCGVMVKDYAHVLANDAKYAKKAARVSDLARDPVEVVIDLLGKEDLSAYHERAAAMGRVAFHAPCTLQHGQKLPMVTENLLAKLGFSLTTVADAHICCGSAGTYSIFQPTLSKKLRVNKVDTLLAEQPDVIATANIGCQLQIQAGSTTRVVHWLELVDRVITAQV